MRKNVIMKILEQDEIILMYSLTKAVYYIFEVP